MNAHKMFAIASAMLAMVCALPITAHAQAMLALTEPAEPAEPTEPVSAGEGMSWALKHRRFSTREGSSGGLMIEDPGTGVAGSVRLQLAVDAAPTDDAMRPGNEVSRTDKTLSVSWSALERLEIYAALRDSTTTLGRPVPDTISAQRSLIGFKLFASIAPTWSFGGGLRFTFQNEIGESVPLLKATNIGLRASAAADLRHELKAPLIARFNLEYLFDNSGQLVAQTEDARYSALGASAATPRNETRHLVSRIERYALDVNRVDQLSIGLGLEAPLAVAADFSLHPLVEWRMGLPVNRQSFDCAIVRGRMNDGSPVNDDACLGTAGTDTYPSHLVSGLRIVPPVRGLSLLLALDLGLSGSSVFVRELAPIAPFTLSITLGYDA
jgi:hypothetical protein